MKFLITKTSDYWNDTKPCDEAYKGTIESIDSRGFKTPEEHDKVLAYGIKNGRQKPWLAEGYNHRIEDGHIVRNMPDRDCWYVDINSLEELFNFCTKYGGRLVLEDSNIYDYKTPEIEIYDSWRE